MADASLTAAPVSVTTTAGLDLDATVATFSDADLDALMTGYSATIDWGDGTPVTNGTILPVASGGFKVAAEHTYRAAGAYSTAVLISDGEAVAAPLRRRYPFSHPTRAKTRSSILPPSPKPTLPTSALSSRQAPR